MKIKVSVKSPLCMPMVFEKGDWIDLKTQYKVSFLAPHAKCLHKHKNPDTEDVDKFRDVVFDYKVIPLGVAMQLPKGFEAIVVPRSSTFKRYGLLQSNSMGIIDHEYCGNNDIWGFPAVAIKAVTIPENTRICQFRIQLSQKATFWQKLRWLFSSKIRLQYVPELSNPDRKGFGEGTGE